MRNPNDKDLFLIKLNESLANAKTPQQKRELLAELRVVQQYHTKEEKKFSNN